MNKKQSYGIVSFREAFEKALNLKSHTIFKASSSKMIVDYGSRTVDFTIIEK